MNKIYTLIFTVILFQSCVRNRECIGEANLTNLIFKLVDTTVTDFRKLKTPSIKDLSSTKTERSFYKKLDSIRGLKIEPLKTILNDTLYDIEVLEQKNNKRDVTNIVLLNNKTIPNLSVKNNDKYEFILKSDLKTENRLSSIIPKYYFSKIYFNTKNDTYFMKFSVNYGKLNGSTFEVLFKIENNDVSIIRVNNLSIS